MKKKNWELKMTRRQVLKAGMIGGAGMMLPLRFLPAKALASPAVSGIGLMDPASQPLFATTVPNALDPGFIYQPDKKGRYKVQINEATHYTGLKDALNNDLPTPIWGYGDGMDRIFTWPGRTFQIQSSLSGTPTETEVFWANSLKKVKQHLLPVDPNLHWCYSLPGYEGYTIANNGVPIITHLHGGNTDFQYDGNPEFFYTPANAIVGPQWASVPGGFTNKFNYNNHVPAGTLWYHDHALGITRLNVYAGLAGFYFVRDDNDTGDGDNKYNLPYGAFELAYAIQDRMFKNTGELFYPAFPGEPAWEGFIYDEGVNLPVALFPDNPWGWIPPEEVNPLEGGGPTALAEFFGDHMVVNGKIWPKTDVYQNWYRLRLLNGCDSRFLVIQFFEVPAGATDFSGAIQQLNFKVIGSDQGLGTTISGTLSSPMNTLVFEPGARYDVLIDFSGVTPGHRVIMKNIGGDEPFGGSTTIDEPGLQIYERTDRIMAFDVLSGAGGGITGNPSDTPIYLGVPHDDNTPVRRVALFEGRDEFGRLQPLLGTVNSGDLNVANVATAYPWHLPTTETPYVNSTEIWEIYNFTADAHPVHLHLVNFQILDRQQFEYEEGDEQTIVQHNGAEGTAPGISYIQNFSDANVGQEYYEVAPKDMVISLPGNPEPEEGDPITGQMVRIAVHFNKTGRYVWHCHILSHEDHEMMRVLQVIPQPV